MSARHQSGATLLEVMVVAAVLILLATQALPLTAKFMERRRVESVAGTLYDDMRFAQSEALRRNVPVHFTVNAGNHWCYGFSVKVGCDCAAVNSCELRTQDSSVFVNTSVAASVPGGSFDPAVGSASPQLITISSLPASDRAKVARFNLGLAGLMSVCSPAGSGFIPGYPAC